MSIIASCLYCFGHDIQKNGVLPKGGQRYKCKNCTKHFAIGGDARGTYKPAFKNAITDLYCHQHQPARSIAHKFHISTSTLIQWAKSHIATCSRCNK